MSPHPEERSTAVGRARSLSGDIIEGLRFVWAQPVLRALALLNATTTLLCGGFTLVVVVLLTELGTSPAQIGIIFGGCGAAGLLGAALTPWFVDRVGAGRTYILSLGASAMLVTLMAVTTSPVPAGMCAAGIVALGPPAAVVLQVARARTIPDRLLARVRAVEMTIAGSTAPLASLLAGVALSQLGPATTCAAIGTGLLVTMTAGLALPAIRVLDER